MRNSSIVYGIESEMVNKVLKLLVCNLVLYMYDFLFTLFSLIEPVAATYRRPSGAHSKGLEMVRESCCRGQGQGHADGMWRGNGRL